MQLKCKINGVEYSNLVQGINISEEYNETLDSASIILSDVYKMDLRPYDDVYIYDGDFEGYGENVPLPSFFYHFLVDQFTEEMINPSENSDEIKYKYKIDLFSETKKLETIQIPNFSITQPLDINKKKTVYEHIVSVVNLYNPIYKKVDDKTKKTWKYAKKYSIDVEKLSSIFGSVYSPDFTLNNPNLRDVLTQLMLTKDVIPIVKNDVITCLEFSKRNGTFTVDENITSIVGSRSSDNHCDGLKRTYNDALSQDNTCRMVEFLGFRNSNSGMLSLENLSIETRYPIYKINKIYMCYYKKIKLLDVNGKEKGERIFLCKQDISKLVKLNNERNLLSEDWVDFEENANSGITIDEMANYKLCTIGYDIGSKNISGWGEKYTYVESVIFDKEKTYIENILKILDIKTPYGIYNYGYITAKGNIPNGYAFSATSGDIGDRIVNVYSNLALGMKSLFFEIDYNAFYNGTIVHSKDCDYDDIVINDNSSSSLTLLEQDGLFQKEKVNRFGNKAIQINATYKNFSDLQLLGSVYNYGGDNDVIIYHREVSINDNVINCVYYGTKDYVMKNYFTSVNAKHRPFNLLPYSESVRRSENKKMYLLMSKDKYYLENENNVLNINADFIDKFLSFYKDTNLGRTKGDFINDDKINYGYCTYNGEKYASDINSFSSGNSMCFNIAMYDNVSGGVYLDKDKLEPDMLNVDDDYIRGSLQKWYITSDDTGYAENVGFFVGHIDTDNMFYDKQVLTNDYESNVKNVIKNRIMALPKIELTENDLSGVIGNDFFLNKDNKEIIDMTFQFEAISDTDDILFSGWMLMLSDLLGNYLKFSTDRLANDFQNEETSYKVITATAKYYEWIGRDTYLAYRPIMVLEFEKELFSIVKEGEFKATFEYSKNVSSEHTGEGMFKNPIYYKFEANKIYDITENGFTLSGTQTIKFDAGFLGISGIKKYVDETYWTFKKVNIISNTEPENTKYWFSTCEVSISTEHSNQFIIEYFGSNNRIVYNNGFSSYDLDDIDVDLSFSTEKIFEVGESFDASNTEQTNEFMIKEGSLDRTIYAKNMFVVFDKKEMQKETVYDEFKYLNRAEVGNVNDIFFFDDNVNGCRRLGIDLSLAPRNTNSIKVYYKDELNYENSTEGLISVGEKGYHFVFGVNINKFNIVDNKIYINLSLLSKKDKRVFDEKHNLVGYMKNEANENNVVLEQKYNEI